MIRLDNERPLIFDGAFGTFYSSEYGPDCKSDYANTQFPSRVFSIHRKYIEAGAGAIKTNTFTLNRVSFPDGNELKKMISAGISVAKEAAGDAALVFADIGTIPDGEPEDYTELAKLFIDCGAENFLFETFAEFEPLKEALDYIRNRLPEAGIIVSFGSSPDGYTRLGNLVSGLIDEAAAHKAVDAVGINCVCGPAHAAHLVPLFKNISKPLSVMPNAGYPSYENGRTVYNDNASYFAEKAKELRGYGVSIIGGCCGTTPEHISALAAAVNCKSEAVKETTDEYSSVSFVKENPFETKLNSGKRVIAVEFDPPAGTDILSVAEAAAQLKKSGCDIVTIADNPLSRSRADSLITACAVTEKTGIPVMPHLTCRDRNRIAIKSGLLAANGLGVRNILAVTGDPLTEEEKGVFSFNSYKLINFISDMNKKEFVSSPYLVGAALNLNAGNFDAELKRAVKKAELGAKLFMTQPVAGQAALDNLKKAHGVLNVPVLAGLYPVAGYRNALFLKNEVSGIDIPDSLISALEGKTKEEALEISVGFTADRAAEIAPYCDGFYIMTPLKRTDIVTALIDRIKEFN